MSCTKNSYVAFKRYGVVTKFMAKYELTKNSYVAFKRYGVVTKKCANIRFFYSYVHDFQIWKTIPLRSIV